MKNRKFIIVAFVLISVMVIGIGYAALTDIFIMDGNAVVNQTKENTVFDENIYISNAVVNGSGTSGVADTASTDSTNPDKASFTVKSLALEGEEPTFVFTIKNDSDFDATIANTVCTVDNSEYFSVAATVPTDPICYSQGTLDVTVTVTLIKALTTEQTANITVNYTATTTT